MDGPVGVNSHRARISLRVPLPAECSVRYTFQELEHHISSLGMKRKLNVVH